MPTGYTAAIADGISFRDFVMQCARSRGALIEMRDDPLDTPIPKRFEPSDYHIKQQQIAADEGQRLQNMTAEEAEIEAQQDFEKACADNARSIDKAKDLRRKYEAMLEQVKAWKPPTAEHVELKQFMIDQIVDSMKFDCDTGMDYYTRYQPKRLTGAEWIKKKLDAAIDNYKYHQDSYLKEVARVESRNRWVKELVESL
ncbi:MAG: hypothetical protein WC343_05325 [Bacilli bacterium]|jgi:hypothetical protein